MRTEKEYKQRIYDLEFERRALIVGLCDIACMADRKSAIEVLADKLVKEYGPIPVEWDSCEGPEKST